MGMFVESRYTRMQFAVDPVNVRIERVLPMRRFDFRTDVRGVRGTDPASIGNQHRLSTDAAWIFGFGFEPRCDFGPPCSNPCTSFQRYPVQWFTFRWIEASLFCCPKYWTTTSRMLSMIRII